MFIPSRVEAYARAEGFFWRTNGTADDLPPARSPTDLSERASVSPSGDLRKNTEDPHATLLMLLMSLLLFF